MAHEKIECPYVIRYGKDMGRSINMRNAFLKTERRKRKIESLSPDPRPGFMNDGETFAYPHNQAGWGYWFPYYFVKHEGMLRKGTVATGLRTTPTGLIGAVRMPWSMISSSTFAVR